MTDVKATTVEAMARGVAFESESSFTRLFEAEYPQVTKTAYLILGDWEQAREVAQEAFTRLFTQWKKVSKYDRPGAWVRRIAIRLAVGSSRKSARLSQALTKFQPQPPEAAEGNPDLRNAIHSLPRAQRAAIVLHYLMDLPVTEVAGSLGCSVGTAKVHLHHARKRLGEILHEELDDVTG